MIETNPIVLQRFQVVLKAKGFYHGKLDGIWGTESIKAKKLFESDPSFEPALPSLGMPFVLTDKLPKGCFVESMKPPMLTCIELEKKPELKKCKAPEQYAEAGEAIEVEEIYDPLMEQVEQEETLKTEPVVEVSAEPVVEQTEETFTEVEAAPVVDEANSIKPKNLHKKKRHRS